MLDGEGLSPVLLTVAKLLPLSSRTAGDRFWVNATRDVHSAVRAALGLPFPGKSVLTSIMLADVRLAQLPADVLAVNAVGDAFAFVAPSGDGWHRIFAGTAATSSPTPHRWRSTTSARSPCARSARTSVCGRRVGCPGSTATSAKPHYRVGRVFLAGDAAHVHCPAGGQGMNTGLQDAANPGWKLAATAQGWAPDGLLDTYEGERHPVGKLVLRTSGAIIRLAMIRSNPHAPRAVDVPLLDSRRLYEVLRDGTFVLVAPSRPRRTCAARLGWRPRGPPTPWPLVRPDAHVAWRGAPAGLDGALARAGLIN